MLKRIQSILFVVCAVMVFTAQANRPDDKGQQRTASPRPAPVARTAPARTAPVTHNTPSRPPVQTRREAPQPTVHRAEPAPRAQPSQSNFQSAHQERQGPRVYAVPTPTPAPEDNNRLFHRQHHNNWQPLYNFYNNEYNFYPYVNVASPVDLSANVVTVLFNGQAYYYDRGSFYLQDPQGYLATPPPLGIIISALPQHARQIEVNGQVYYRYKGVFYTQVPQGYQVIGPLQSASGS